MARVAGVDMFTGAASRFVISINIRNDGLWAVTDRHGLFGQPNVWNTYILTSQPGLTNYLREFELL